MKLVWTVKLYDTGGAKTPYRVKVEGNPSGRSDRPWTFAEGKGATPLDALRASLNEMSMSDQASLRLLFNPEEKP